MDQFRFLQCVLEEIMFEFLLNDQVDILVVEEWVSLLFGCSGSRSKIRQGIGGLQHASNFPCIPSRMVLQIQHIGPIAGQQQVSRDPLKVYLDLAIVASLQLCLCDHCISRLQKYALYLAVRGEFCP